MRGAAGAGGQQPHAVGQHLMPDCIAACARQEPDIQLVLLDRIQQDVLGSVRAGEVDFGVVIDPRRPATCTPGDHARPLRAGGAVEHALMKPRTVRWSALSGQPLVLLDHASGSRRLIDTALQRHGAQCEVVQELGHLPPRSSAWSRPASASSVMPALAVP